MIEIKINLDFNYSEIGCILCKTVDNPKRTDRKIENNSKLNVLWND